MKNIAYILIILLAGFPGLLKSADNNIMFENANELYHNKNYDSAAQLYQQMINDGYCHADLYYNAGNAYYRANKTGMAVWCFRKALQLNDQKNYRDNLLLAQKKITQPIQAAEDIFFIRWWKNFYNIFSINQWAIAALIGFMISMSLLFMKNIFHKQFPSGGSVKILISLTGICMVLLAVKYYHDTRHFHGIVVEEQTAFTSSSQSLSATLSAGIEVEYLNRQKDKLMVKLPDGRTGEIKASAFKKL